MTYIYSKTRIKDFSKNPIILDLPQEYTVEIVKNGYGIELIGEEIPQGTKDIQPGHIAAESTFAFKIKFGRTNGGILEVNYNAVLNARKWKLTQFSPLGTATSYSFNYVEITFPEGMPGVKNPELSFYIA